MSASYYVCENCGEAFPSSSSFICGRCNRVFCSNDCGGKQNIGASGKTSCKYCRREQFSDLDLLTFALHEMGLSRVEWIEKVMAADTCELYMCGKRNHHTDCPKNNPRTKKNE